MTTQVTIPDGSGERIEIKDRNGHTVATIRAVAYSDGSWANLDITWPQDKKAQLNSWDNGVPAKLEHDDRLKMVSVDLRAS